MSTRGFYRFVDVAPADDTPADVYNVYKHSDNYPSGGLQAIINTLDYVWPLPRYEANEFSAGFVAANKGYYAQLVVAQAIEKAKPLFDASPGSYDDFIVNEIAVRPFMFRHGGNGGGVRLHGMGATWEHIASPDIEYLYTVYPGEGSLVRGGWLPNEIVLYVRCESVHCRDWQAEPLVWETNVVFDIPLGRVQQLLRDHANDFEVVADVLQKLTAG